MTVKITTDYKIFFNSWFCSSVRMRIQYNCLSNHNEFSRHPDDLIGRTTCHLKLVAYRPWVHPVSSQRYPSRLESRAGFFASTRDECLSPRVRLECNNPCSWLLLVRSSLSLQFGSSPWAPLGAWTGGNTQGHVCKELRWSQTYQEGASGEEGAPCRLRLRKPLPWDVPHVDLGRDT